MDQEQLPPVIQGLIDDDFEMCPDLPNPLGPDPALLDCPDTPLQDEDEMNLDCSRGLLSDPEVDNDRPTNTEDAPAASTEDAAPALDPAPQ